VRTDSGTVRADDRAIQDLRRHRPRVGPPSRTYERGAQASGAGPNISATVAAWLVASVNLWQGGAAYMRGLESETDRGLYTEVGR
jgi:hypothetical protein